ncbi:R213A-like protein [Mya arenaria]|uniref:R213A-like protein n=1 Tax=Mya arenaria TaxID=6604 RepID=A0ABY7EEH4_MYAAR|nr:R213A-like protein [Mya arenaria]
MYQRYGGANRRCNRVAMKKCSNPKCGLEVEAKICPECGWNMVDPSINPILSSMIIICDGADERGLACGAELKAKQKFCSICGKKVDSKLFEVLTPCKEKCGKCGTELTSEEKFCPECGFKIQPMAKQVADAQPSQENQAIVVDKSDPVCLTASNIVESQNDIQQLQPAPKQSSIPTSQQTEGTDLSTEVKWPPSEILKSANEVEHLCFKGPDKEQTLQDQTLEKDKQQEPDTDRLSAGDVQEGETSSPEPKEDRPGPHEMTGLEETQTNKPVAVESQKQVDHDSPVPTCIVEGIAMDTSNPPGDNRLHDVNIDDGNDERKQRPLMQDGPGSKIDEANARTNINNKNCESPDAFNGEDSEPKSTTYQENALTKVGHEKDGHVTVESELENNIKGIHITVDEKMNESSNGEIFENDLSDNDGSEDDSADSDSSESVANIDDADKRKYGGKRTKRNLKGGAKAKKAKKRERKKEKHCEKHNLPLIKKEEKAINDRPTEHSVETKSFSQVAEVAAKAQQRTTGCLDRHDNKNQQNERVFGQGIQEAKQSTNVDTFKVEDDHLVKKTASFFEIPTVKESNSFQEQSSTDSFIKQNVNSEPVKSDQSTNKGTDSPETSDKKNKNIQNQQASQNQNPKDRITVVFHVLVAKDFLKSNTDILILKMDDSSLDVIFQHLFPLFEMDFYLPRSIVASLLLSELPFLIDNEAVPVEVCSAALLYWMKKIYGNQNMFGNLLEEENVGNEKIVLVCMEKLINRLRNVTNPERAIARWEMSFCITKEMVDYMGSKSKKLTLAYSLQAFLHTLCMYSQFQKDTKKMESVLDALSAVGNKIRSWLKRYASSYWTTGMLENFKVWELAMAENLSDQEIEIKWNEKISAELQYVVERELRMYDERQRDFIKLYCEEVNKFSTAMNGCLTKIALKAIEGGCMIDFTRFGLQQKQRFKDLMSDLYDRQWKKTVTDGPKEDRDILDTSAIDEVLHKTSKLENHSLIEFCKPKAVENFNETIEPDLRAFDVEPEILDILPTLERLAQGVVFKKIWREVCSVKTEGCVTPFDVVNMVWKPAFERWNIFRELLQTGELMFEDADKRFRSFKGEDEKLLQEMLDLELPRATADERIKQIKQNRQLSDCVEGATHSERNFKLRDFNESLMKTCEILKHITKEKSNCLDAFVNSANLVKWLKESMPGQKELKVFVDLAMMSAGEEPMNIAKVQCLHSAVLGYSPLIFDLDETTCNHKSLLDKCNVVWKELAANPNLPEQLLDTNRELEWLKEIKKAHGSVEVTSLMQAEAINTDGIYTVGKEAWKGSELSDMDLQSRLMLVVGKSDSSFVKSTDKKSEVNVDSITRLGSVYLKLCSSGCVLFNGWNANFLCSLEQKRLVCAKLEFGKGEDIPILRVSYEYKDA